MELQVNYKKGDILPVDAYRQPSYIQLFSTDWECRVTAQAGSASNHIHLLVELSGNCE